MYLIIVNEAFLIIKHFKKKKESEDLWKKVYIYIFILSLDYFLDYSSRLSDNLQEKL